MKKLLTVIGTRPQFIKYAAISTRLRRNFREILVDTGQHYSKKMSSDFIKELNIPHPDYTIGVSSENVVSQIAEMIKGLYPVIERHKPDILLCFGDTNSALAAALSGLKYDIPVVHIEAGERNYDKNFKRVPAYTIPEEANRIAIDSFSAHLICSSRRAYKNLTEEKVTGSIFYSGDIMLDIYLKNFKEVLKRENVLNKYGLKSKQYYFVTIHRAINTDNMERMKAFYNVFKNLEKTVILPLHPRTLKKLRGFNLYNKFLTLKNLVLTEPVGYLDSLVLNYHAACVMTDSGGVIREAYFNGVPSVMLDDTSEWLDLYESNWSFIAGADEEAIMKKLEDLRVPDKKPDFFGDGKAGLKTVNYLKKC
ncbi:MAG: UDP-N-acetylglucosamine 2-epimerase (non-hydrolyzing) [Ignavibacteria bacterium]|nr:UDP-N-acetylglucosamine 2-epimerase (non-hydrolyzing) [Ignavibacteria bacterium]